METKMNIKTEEYKGIRHYFDYKQGITFVHEDGKFNMINYIDNCEYSLCEGDYWQDKELFNAIKEFKNQIINNIKE